MKNWRENFAWCVWVPRGVLVVGAVVEMVLGHGDAAGVLVFSLAVTFLFF